MKKFIMSILMAILFHLMVQAQQIIYLEDGRVESQLSSTVPTRDLEYVDGGILVTYTFNKALIYNDDVYPETYWWKMDGLSNSEIPGYASVPFNIDRFSIPFGNVASVELVDSSYTDFDYALAPAREPLSDNSEQGYTINNVPKVEMRDSWIPENVTERLDNQEYRGTMLCNVIVNPVQYNSFTSTVRAYKKIVYKIVFEEDLADRPNTDKSDISIDNPFFVNNTLNFNDSRTYKVVNESAILNNQDYLIVTVPKYENLIEDFAVWKRYLGFNVKIISKEKWDYETVAQAVRDYYANTPTLNYLLIVGNNEDVPGKKLSMIYDGDTYVYYTDFYLGCKNDNSEIADIYRGRIPVDSEDDCNTIFEKIVNYEKNPITEHSFYNNGLNCAYFEDKLPAKKPDGIADRRFAKTSEDIRNYLINQGKDVERVYFASSNVYPKSWNNGAYYDGDEFPDELLKPGFAWSGNATHIKNAIDRGVFYILHRDHGGTTSWGSPSFTTKDISELRNGEYLPIVFSLNCLTGTIDKWNNPLRRDTTTYFAEKFLRKKGGGCVAIFGATQISFSGYNDVLACAMFDAVWPIPGLNVKLESSVLNSHNQQPVYRIGQILDQGLLKMAQTCGETYGFQRRIQYTKEIFHCYGDPSMMFPTEAPTPFEGISCVRKSDVINVSIPDCIATISFVDRYTNKVESYKGSNISYYVDDARRIDVCVSGHNKIPFLSYGADEDEKNIYIQNIILKGPKTLRGKNVYIGSNVDSKNEQGPVVLSNGGIVISGEDIFIYPDTTVKNDVMFKNN